MDYDFEKVKQIVCAIKKCAKNIQQEASLEGLTDLHDVDSNANLIEFYVDQLKEELGL